MSLCGRVRLFLLDKYLGRDGWIIPELNVSFISELYKKLPKFSEMALASCVPEVCVIEFDYFTHLLVLLSLVVSHCVFNSHFPISNDVSIFAYLGRLCFSRFLYSVGSKIFEMPEAFQVKIATQISERLEQSFCPDPSCTNQDWGVEITRLIHGTNAEYQRDCSKDMSTKLGKKPVP